MRILMFHKPKGVEVTRAAGAGRTVYDLLPAWVRGDGWVPAGRLDSDSRGLLFFVRDGKLVDMLTRPGGCVKTYEVWVRGRVTPEHLRRMAEGVATAAGVLRAQSVRLLGGAGPKTRLQVDLDEGKNRHIRRLFGALRDPERGTPLKVVDLKRTAVGPIRLDVPSGAWRALTENEEMNIIENSRSKVPAGGRSRRVPE
jgi:23S rRNA pseudouridine2605 synthase